jgi:elongation factor 1-alpha
MPWFKRRDPPQTPAGPPTTPPRADPPPLRSESGADPGTPPPVRFRIEDVYAITGLGPVLVGEVESGMLRAGQQLKLAPGPGSKTVPRSVQTVSVEANHRIIAEAGPGTRIGVEVNGMGKRDARRGDLLTS